MEFKGEKTILREEISVTSNKYLEEIESWNEQDLPCYKRKVRTKIFDGFLSIIAGVMIAYACYLLFFAIGFSTVDNLPEILGYANSNGLITLFKKHVGQTPLEFRKKNR